MPEPTVEIVGSNLSEHPATRAWRHLLPGGCEPAEIVVLSRRLKSTIFRLVGVAPAGCSVIAKYCRSSTARYERIIYEKILPELPVATPQFYGFIAGEK